MSKTQKGNKENKKPKADKNRSKSISGVQGDAKSGKAGQQQVRKNVLTQLGRETMTDQKPTISVWSSALSRMD
jgi:hypothetical protein